MGVHVKVRVTFFVHGFDDVARSVFPPFDLFCDDVGCINLFRKFAVCLYKLNHLICLSFTVRGFCDE